MKRICTSCGQPIQPGEGFDEIIPHSMSGSRPTAYRHKRPCRPPLISESK
ncbi:hypothetical protein [Streptomyces sp. A012304]|nr:hypothetical protein [Streptomyces sp. A012304]